MESDFRRHYIFSQLDFCLVVWDFILYSSRWLILIDILFYVFLLRWLTFSELEWSLYVYDDATL